MREIPARVLSWLGRHLLTFSLMIAALLLKLLWPRYSKGSEVYLSENVSGLTPITAAQFATEHKCGFWDQVLIYETPGRS